MYFAEVFSVLGCDGERWNGTEPLGCRTPPAPSSTEEGSQGGRTVRVLESLEVESNAHKMCLMFVKYKKCIRSTKRELEISELKPQPTVATDVPLAATGVI